jgi:hypothetical protein
MSTAFIAGGVGGNIYGGYDGFQAMPASADVRIVVTG